MRQAEESLQQLEARYKSYVQQLDEWYNREADKLRKTSDTMAELLKPYAADLIARGKSKSVTLPDGAKAGFRAQQPTIRDDDPDRTLEWCKQYAPEAVVTKESVSKGELRRMLKAGKALPPDVEIEPQPDRFYVDVRDDVS